MTKFNLQAATKARIAAEQDWSTFRSASRRQQQNLCDSHRNLILLSYHLWRRTRDVDADHAAATSSLFDLHGQFGNIKTVSRFRRPNNKHKAFLHNFVLRTSPSIANKVYLINYSYSKVLVDDRRIWHNRVDSSTVVIVQLHSTSALGLVAN